MTRTKSLLSRLRKGDSSATGELYALFRDSVVGIVFARFQSRLTRNMIEDAYTDSILRFAYRTMHDPEFSISVSVKNYLIAMVRNKAIKQSKVEAATVQLLNNEVPFEEIETDNWKHEILIYVNNHLNELERLILHAFFWEKLPDKETAKDEETQRLKPGITPANVRKIRSRCLAKLRNRFLMTTSNQEPHTYRA